MIARRERATDDDAIFEVKNVPGGDGPWIELYHTYDPETAAIYEMQMPLREFRWLVEEVGPTIIKMAEIPDGS